MTPREVLVAARKLIERPEAWTQGATARDAAGKVCSSREPSAVCRCAGGAIETASDGDLRKFLDAFEALGEQLGRFGYDVEAVNDAPERTHAEVLAAFDAAILACGEAP